MSKRSINIKTGIEIWDGLPGSGKSYSSVDELVKIIINERRPVFTNLPLKMQVLKRYLVVRSLNPAAANYIQYLNQDHFNRFIERNHVWTKFSEELKGDGFSQGYIERAFNDEFGEGIIKGEDANWIPIGSVLILDEFHRWADQRMQRAEDPAFLLYATMHRHHMHRVIIATQDAMQVSITWRRNSDLLVHHTDKRKLPFMFGLSLPIPAFAREFWPKEYISESRVGQQPTKVEVFIPFLTGGLIWRLYDSFTHMGGARRLNRSLEKTRQLIEGDKYEKQTQGDQDVAVKPTIKRRLWGVFKTMCMLAILIWMGGKLAELGSQNQKLVQKQADEQKRYEEQMKTMRAQIAALSVPATNQNGTQGHGNPPSVSTVGNGYCIANGQLVKIGQTVNGFELKGLNYGASNTTWMYQGMDFIVPLMRSGMHTSDQRTHDGQGTRARLRNGRTVDNALGQIEK